MDATPQDRGHSRLDSFVDAAFAFALTLLILTADASAPRSMAEFVQALQRIPAFAVSFSLIAMFWHAHVLWSRHYGPRDALGTLISVTLVFTVLVFVYPLRTMSSAFMHFLSGGALPGEFNISSLAEFRVFVVTYGASYLAMSLLMAGLYAHSLRRRLETALDETRLSSAQTHRNIWLIQAGAALLSLVLVVTGATGAMLSMWAYALLGIVLPVYGTWAGILEKRRDAASKAILPAPAAVASSQPPPSTQAPEMPTASRPTT
jgi:uncharacterized membrane protein